MQSPSGYSSGETHNSDFTERGPCPDCGSSDACASYTDGHTHCFSCNKTTQGQEPVEKKVQSQQRGLLKGKPRAIPARGLTEETCRKFGYLCTTYKGQAVQLAAYRDKHGKPVAQKMRTPNKDFQIFGDAKAMTFYGSHMWSTGKKLVITEGEIDAMSVSQVQGHKWPIVSLPNGAQSAVRAIKANWDYLSGFQEIIFMFDMDEHGQKAAQECAEILPVGKSKIALLPLKDANACLQANRGGDIINAIFQAKDFRPDGVKSSADYRATITDIDDASSISYPYAQLNNILRGMRTSELVTITSGSGLGKSTLVRELAYHLHHVHKQKTGLIMLEESNKRSLLGLTGIHLNKNISINRDEATTAEIEEAYEELFGEQPIYLYDHFGSNEVSTICSRIEFMAKAMGVKWVILDHISILISGLETQNERIAIDQAMTALRTLVQNTDIGLILVSHLKRPDGNLGHEDGAAVHLGQLRGSHAIAQLSDICIGMSVDREDPDADTRNLHVLKNRYTGETGFAGTLQYNREAGRLLDEINPFNK